MATEGSGYPTVAFLEIDGKVLSGEEFEEYCKDHGLCRRCARVRTHHRTLKLFGRGKKWEPLTLHDETTGEYSVYKGYCLQPTCYTIGQAKRLLGESGSGRKSSSRRQRLSDRFKRDNKRRPSRRRPKANPETGSVMSGVADDDRSLASDMSGVSQMSGLSIVSGMSGMSGFSGIGSGMRKGRRSKRSSSNASTTSSISSMDFSDDDTIDSTMTRDVNPVVPSGEVNPIVSHRVEQLMLYDYFTVLDLSKVELRQEDLDAVSKALTKAKTLESVILDKCKLKDDGVEKIMSSLKQGGHVRLKKLSLRQNGMGNRGAISLEFLLRQSTTLEELDLSENSISSRGATAILTSLNQNSNIPLHTLNLSQNEIWDMDDGAFLKTNTTLKVFNLDGNFMHDEGAEQIAGAIAQNKATAIEKLYLGWNGISDDGATALAKMMESNSSLQVLGLAENDISNTGARAILSALAVNTSVREISGLYHNQIDRKFIIVAIKRLLHRYGERTGVPPLIDDTPPSSQEKKAHLSSEEKEERGDVNDNSDGSINWAAQLYSGPKSGDDDAQAARTSVALEAIEHWDWGTFGIEEIENANKSAPPEPMPEPDDEELVEEPVPQGEDESLKAGRVTVFRSAPLAYFNRKTSEHHDIPLLDFDYENKALEEALANKEALGSSIELVHETATQDRLSAFFTMGISPILHFSGHGHPDCLALENGFGYMQPLPHEELKKMVALGKGATQVVVVSSVHAEYIASAFLDAGIKHVVCCNREAVFRDDGPVEFSKAFYQSLAQDKTLQDAFLDGIDAVKRSPLVKSSKSLADRFLLLPKKPQKDDYHKVKVFFQNPLPKKPILPVCDKSMLPPLPSHFVGREVDMYEILESLRVDDVIRVGGASGSGKNATISAVTQYILDRPQSFGISDVFWLPAPPDIYPDVDSCYGDLCQVMDLLVEAEDDIWDEDLYAECRERIMLELNDKRTILVIDGRVFTTEASGENLERFLTHLLNEASVKIILLTAHEGSARTKRSRSEETLITMGPLNFKSSSLLFGNACPHISSKSSALVHTPEEFANFLVPPSVKKQGVDLKKDLSRRQKELYERMGKGIPKDIVEAAKAISQEDFHALLRFAQRPEVQVDSAEVLKAEATKRQTQKEKAIQSKNYLRAQDLSEALEELETLRKKYPALDDLQSKEKELKQEFSELLKARKYDEANKVKRKILDLKKVMMKEKFSKPKGSNTFVPSDKLQQLQAKMDGMLAQANQMKLEKGDMEDATFTISRMGGSSCTLKISKGQIVTYRSKGGMSGIVCWANENCDLTTYEMGQRILNFGAENLKEDIDGLPEIASTEWGAVKCATGEAVIIGPRSYSRLAARYVVVGVPPLSPTNDDEDWDGETLDEDALHYLDTGLRACFRSSFNHIKSTGLEGVGIPTITTKEGGKTYERTLQVGLQTLVEEIKTTKLTSVHLMATSGNEAKMLIRMALTMGLNYMI